MNLEYFKPEPETFPQEFERLLRKNRLYPSMWEQNPALLVASLPRSVFWKMVWRGKVLGLVWLSDIAMGYSANIYILLDNKYLRWCKPKRELDHVRLRKSKRRMKRVVDSAFKEIFDYCFNDLDLVRVTAAMPVTRKAAQRLARRFGFVREGRLYDAALVSGRVEDLAVYGYTQKMYGKSVASEAIA